MYAVCSLPPGSVPPPPILDGFYSVSYTPDEVSVFCLEEAAPAEAEIEPGWRGLRIVGKLPFLQVGVVAEISATLAAAKVPIMTISTFDTDYFFVQEAQYGPALDALDRAGHRVGKATWDESLDLEGD
jgi:hypothetical protein